MLCSLKPFVYIHYICFNILIPARASTYKLEACLLTTNTTMRMFTNFLSTKSETEENVTIPTGTCIILNKFLHIYIYIYNHHIMIAFAKRSKD